MVPAAEPPHGGLREAPRFATVQQDGEHTARVKLPFVPLKDVGGAGDFCTQGAKGLGYLHDAGIGIVVVRQTVRDEGASRGRRMRLPPRVDTVTAGRSSGAGSVYLHGCRNTYIKTATAPSPRPRSYLENLDCTSNSSYSCRSARARCASCEDVGGIRNAKTLCPAEYSAKGILPLGKEKKLWLCRDRVPASVMEATW